MKVIHGSNAFDPDISLLLGAAEGKVKREGRIMEGCCRVMTVPA
jgi:hypothetical protein